MLSSVKLLNRWELYLVRNVNIFGYLEHLMAKCAIAERVI